MKMPRVARINGVSVYSDKEVLDVVNTRVQFVDGSWCDTKSGQIVSKGEGNITISGTSEESESSEEITKGPTQFEANCLDLRDLSADVSVEPYNGSGIEVTINGPSDEVEAVEAEVRDETLYVKQRPQSGGGITIKVSGGTSHRLFKRLTQATSIISVGSITITDGGESTVKVSIKVPVGTPITLSGLSGKTVIGDTEGPLTATTSGFAAIKIGSVTDANLTATSSGGITVNQVTGSLVALTRGFGDITVNGGSITTLEAKTTGSGKLRIKASAANASLETTGFGDIVVNEVNGNVTAKTTGSGKISVESGNVAHLEAKTTGFGNIVVDGTAETASLTTTGSGDIRVAAVRQQPTKRQTGFGKIKVGSVG